MPALLPSRPAAPEARAAAGRLAVSSGFQGNPAAQAALWLYVDELDRSHAISQNLHTAVGSFLHGVMHRREGDFWNSHYWMRQARGHSDWPWLPGHDPDAFIDAVAAAKGKNPPGLLDTQRREWLAVMTWCLRCGE